MRPNTLREACERFMEGVPAAIAFSEVWDTFYGQRDGDGMYAVISDEPPLTGDARIDAFVAAAAEYLAKQYSLPGIPKWIKGKERYLSEPWFTTDSDDPAMRDYLSFSSPAEFRMRNIFTEERPLRRASQARTRRLQDSPPEPLSPM